jgi:hypothetical protein
MEEVMVRPASSHRPPSPIALRTADHAVAVINLVARPRAAPETICLLADDGYLPLSCVVVDGAGQPAQVFDIAELVGHLGASMPIAYVVVASVRPRHPFEADDIHRWFELSAMLADGGIELVEWFIRDRRAMVAVTALAGVPSRWPDQ